MRLDRPGPILKIRAKCHLFLEERDITGKTCLEQPELFTIYRVNYDTAWWREIAETLRTDKSQIPPINRAQVSYHHLHFTISHLHLYTSDHLRRTGTRRAWLRVPQCSEGRAELYFLRD